MTKTDNQNFVGKKSKKNVPIYEIMHELLQTSNSIETILYEGIVGIKANSEKQAQAHFAQDLEVLYAELCHYFDLEVDLITNPNTPFYHKLGATTPQEFRKNYESKRKQWLKNKQWKQKFESNLRNVWNLIVKPENLQKDRGYIYSFDGEETYWPENGAKLENYFTWKFRTQNPYIGGPFSNDLYDCFEYLCYSPDNFLTEVENLISQILDEKETDKWVRILNNLARNEKYPKDKTIFYSIKHDLENWGQDGWFKAVRYRGKKKTKWTAEDYNFYIPDEEKQILVDLSNKIGHFIEVYQPGMGFFEDEFGEISSWDKWCGAVATGVEELLRTEGAMDEYYEDPDSSHITQLSLIRIHLKEVPEEVFNFKYLTKLDLCSNDLRKIPKEIGKLRFLKELWIFGNPIEMKYLKLLRDWDCDYSYKITADYAKSYGKNEMLTLDDIIYRIEENKGLDFTMHIPQVFIKNRKKILEICYQNHNNTAEYAKKFAEMEFIKGEPIDSMEAPHVIDLLNDLRQDIPIYRAIVKEYDDDLFFELKQGIILRDGHVHLLFLKELHLQQVPKSVANFTKMKELNLSDNELTDLPLTLANLKNLEIISFDGNHFSDMPPVLGGLDKLIDACFENLNLENDQEGNLFPKDVRDFAKIKYQIAIWNFEEFKQNIEVNRKIRMCDAANPKILEYESEITELIKNLKNESENEKLILDLELIIKQQKTLKKLEDKLGFPLIFTFNRWLKKGFCLKDARVISLNLESCNLTSLPDEIFDLVDLEELFISNNPLQEISHKILKLRKLSDIYLENTHIKTLPLNIVYQCYDEIIFEDNVVLTPLEEEILSEYYSSGFKEFLNNKYEEWSLQDFVQRMKNEEPATLIDKTHPKLLQMRPQLEDELIKVNTKASNEFLEYLREISQISVQNSKYSIFL